MKKLFCIIFIFSSFFLSFTKPSRLISVTGNIIMTDNEPFSKPCIISNGKEYGISASEEVLKKIKKASAEQINVCGELYIPGKNEKSPYGGKDGTIILESWSVVE